jgi:prepilin-type N-terminal cleavage/methylation domain-containing protein
MTRLSNLARSRSTRRRAFTLVELLVVMVIVAILATVVLFTYMNAMELGKRARTQAQITKIDHYLMEKWEEFVTRRIPLRITPQADRSGGAMIRLNARRDLMRMDLPDRITDVTDEPANLGGNYKLQRTSLSKKYLSAKTANWNSQNQGAECLYMILYHMADRDGSPLDFFRDTEISDTDDDQMPEIIDGWGKPITFLRWAPGFVSDKQPDISTIPVEDRTPDPFDPLGTHEKYTAAQGAAVETFPLFPLILSAGPDGEYNLTVSSDDGSSSFSYTGTDPPCDPYHAFTSDGKTGWLGQPNRDDGTELDNLHNHTITTRLRP